MIKTTALRTAVAAALLFAVSGASAADYVIDDAHSFVQFRAQHLGYSWLYGRFNTFAGSFSYDENNPAAARIELTVDTTSLDSNHAERDRHLRSEDFLDVERFPQARFVSTAVTPTTDTTMMVAGNLTLHGVTQPVLFEVDVIGGGPDPWGGNRYGFHGQAWITLADFGIDKVDLGPKTQRVQLLIGIEGVYK